MISQSPAGKWFKSSRSPTANECVEVCHEPERTGVRDSKHPGGPELFFSPEEWAGFVRFVSE